MNTIEISKVMQKLGYSDLRAARDWCNENNVQIIKHGKTEFVIEANFLEAYELPFINNLKKKYGNDWQDVYRLYNEGNIPALNLLCQVRNESTRLQSKTKSSQKNDSIYESYLKKFETNAKNKAA